MLGKFTGVDLRVLCHEGTARDPSQNNMFTIGGTASASNCMATGQFNVAIPVENLSRFTVGRTVLAEVAFFNFQDTPLGHFLDPWQVEDHASSRVFKKAWQALS